MKSLLTLAAAAALIVAVQSENASAAAPAPQQVQSGEISDAQLAELGFGGMQRVSDEEGREVRGRFLGRLIQINFFQINRGQHTVTNIFLSSPLQLFSLLY